MSVHVDKIPFPATPEEMYELLCLEEWIKREGGLTDQGVKGYILVKSGYVLIDVSRVEVYDGAIAG